MNAKSVINVGDTNISYIMSIWSIIFHAGILPTFLFVGLVCFYLRLVVFLKIQIK